MFRLHFLAILAQVVKSDTTIFILWSECARDQMYFCQIPNQNSDQNYSYLFTFFCFFDYFLQTWIQVVQNRIHVSLLLWRRPQGDSGVHVHATKDKRQMEQMNEKFIDDFNADKNSDATSFVNYNPNC